MFSVRAISLLCVPMTLLFAGCTSSRTFQLQPVSDNQIHGRVTIARLPESVRTDPADNQQFEATLTRNLEDKLHATIGQPPDLVIQYRFVLFDQGSGAARTLSGIANLAGSPVYGAGDGAIGVEIVYARPDGAQIGHIISEGPISGAFGSSSSAIKSAAAAVADYTKANFTCPACGQIGAENPSPSNVRGLTTAQSKS